MNIVTCSRNAVMHTSGELRFHAAELLKLVETAKTPEERSCLVALMRQWRRMAEQLDATRAEKAPAAA